MPSKDSNNLTKSKEEQHPRSFQNPLNVHPASDRTIHQSTNSDHAQNVTEFITVEENVKWNIGKRSSMGTNEYAVSNNNRIPNLIKILLNNFKIFLKSYMSTNVKLFLFFFWGTVD